MTIVRPVPLTTLAPRLSVEENLVFATVDAPLPLDDLAAQTGLEPRRVEAIVERLAALGVLALERSPAAPALRKAQTAQAPRLETAASRDEPGMATDDDAEPAEALAEAAAIDHDEPSFRQLYESRYRALPRDARIAAARTARGVDLLALCFDAEAPVVAAVLDNSSAGLDHARLIALHHRTGAGLELLARRSELLRDAMVERRLLRNPQCGEAVLQRILAPKALLPTYRICVDRDTLELTRTRSRATLRRKFQAAPPEERAHFVLRTEGRCLPLLTGCTFDGRTTQLLCARPCASVLLIQSLARFPATPPALLAHLLRQPLVRQNQALRKILLQHPNVTGELKQL